MFRTRCIAAALALALPARPASAQPAMPPAPLGVPMDRAGSGTTWIPDAIQLPTHNFMTGGWDLMLHGFVFAQYDRQGGRRGASQTGSLNWGMFMASHRLLGGRFQARTMLSLDPATVTPRGYPLLLQTGETFDGLPLRDRQHPHDFWMELGATYERSITRQIGFALYAAPSGEPALGPVAFMHRPSAMDNPMAPLGHHWQDATHVAFGVLTAGLFTHRLKVEASVFNGREPDEHRWNFDGLALDSYAGRVSFNPGDGWALSTGYGYLRSPESLHPDESMHRLTGSVMHGIALGTEGQWATTFVYGANRHPAGHGLSQSALLESEAVLNRVHTFFGRAEFVQKDSAELLPDSPASAVDAEERRFNIGSLSLGYVRELRRGRGVTLGVGAMATVNVVPAGLATSYGSRTPVGGVVFLRLRALLNRDGMAHMPGMHMSDTAIAPTEWERAPRAGLEGAHAGRH